MRPEKTAIVRELHDQLEKATYVLLADYHGLNVSQIAELRGKLRPLDSEFHVVKNTFFGLAAKELGWEGLDSLLSGPIAAVTGAGDVTEAAKALKDFVKANGKPVARGGVLDSKVLTAAEVEALASLPARPVMLGQLVGTVAAPLSQLVGVMNQKVLSLLYVLKAVEEKKQGN